MIFSLYNSRELRNEKGRLYYYDNAKFILIFLVVAAHFLSPLKPTFPFVRVVWTTINTFHMPAFIFISGFFAKSYIAKDRAIKVQRTSTYVILFLAAQIAVSLFEKFVLGKLVMPSLMSARSSLWFLQCLIIWHLVLPFFARFKAAIIIPAVTLVALYVGYESMCADFLSLSRAFVHFPFFLCGYYCTQETIDRLFTWKARVPLLLLSGGLITMFALLPQTCIGKVITANHSYETIESIRSIPIAFWWTARLAFYACALILGAAFLSVIPRGRVAYTSLGAQSLSVYILHRFVYLAELEYSWATYFASWWGIALLIVIALVMTILFSVKPFTIPFTLLQRIKIDKLLRN